MFLSDQRWGKKKLYTNIYNFMFLGKIFTKKLYQICFFLGLWYIWSFLYLYFGYF